MLSTTAMPCWVPPAAPLLQERWDAGAHLGSHPGERSWVGILDVVGRAEEGARDEAKGLAWRPSNMVYGMVTPTPDQLLVSPPPHAKGVGPGDLLLSKLLPPRAAVVVDATPRLPADGNCIRLRGARLGDALWIASLFAHPAFAPVVARLCVGTALPRIGVRDLASLAIPAVPEVMALIAPRWQEAANAWTDAERGVAELMLLVQRLADDVAEPVPDAHVPAFVAPGLVRDTWVPEQVALARYRADLAGRGWVPLATHLMANPPRVRESLPAIRLLRLSDADDTFGFTVPPVTDAPDNSFRVYATPLRPGEILLSTLGSASKVVVNHPPVESSIWLSDQWVRVEIGATTGAVALLLTTNQVRWQMERAATGVVRQFVSRDDLGDVLLPPISQQRTRDLHERLLALLQARSDAQTRLRFVRADVGALINCALRSSP